MSRARSPQPTAHSPQPAARSPWPAALSLPPRGARSLQPHAAAGRGTQRARDAALRSGGPCGVLPRPPRRPTVRLCRPVARVSAPPPTHDAINSYNAATKRLFWGVCATVVDLRRLVGAGLPGDPAGGASLGAAHRAAAAGPPGAAAQEDPGPGSPVGHNQMLLAGLGLRVRRGGRR